MWHVYSPVPQNKQNKKGGEGLDCKGKVLILYVSCFLRFDEMICWRESVHVLTKHLKSLEKDKVQT